MRSLLYILLYIGLVAGALAIASIFVWPNSPNIDLAARLVGSIAFVIVGTSACMIDLFFSKHLAS